MDKKRAIEIAKSPIMANVTLDGLGVYIETVDETKNTAIVHTITHPDKKDVVPLSSLIEH